MKIREWQRLFHTQAKLGKLLFTPTELANAAGVPRRTVNMEMTRLVRYGVAVRYARGRYGAADSAVPLEQLVLSLDPHAYVTGAFALLRHGIVTQVPTVLTGFTTRRHFRREIQTPAARIEFVTVRPPIYRRETQGIAGAELALCDFVYIALRRGMNPAGLLTFRRLHSLRRPLLERVLRRYPATVRRRVAALVGSRAGDSDH